MDWGCKEFEKGHRLGRNASSLSGTNWLSSVFEFSTTKADRDFSKSERQRSPGKQMSDGHTHT